MYDEVKEASMLTEIDAKELLRSYRIPTTAPRLCHSASELDAAFDELGVGEVVLKLNSSTIMHKARVNGVQVGVPREEAQRAFESLSDAGAALTARGEDVSGILVEPYVRGTSELALGFHLDDALGPLTMVSDGGTQIEDAANVVFGHAPMTRSQCELLIESWIDASASATSGGLTESQRHQLVATLHSLVGEDGLVVREGVSSLDLNPLVVNDDGIIAVDAVIERGGQSVDGWLSTKADSERTRLGFDMILEPRSVAVVGASTDPRKLGYRQIKNLVDFGFKGSIYPVHPSADEVYGCPAVPSLSDIPEPVDKAIVVVRREILRDVIAEAVDVGIPIVQVYTSGFSEWSSESESEEARVLDLLDGSRTRMVGPNCVGAYSPISRLAMSTPDSASTTEGRVAFVSQSGTYALDAIRRSNQAGLPLYGAVSVGNCLDAQPHEYAAHYLAKEEVDVLGLYVETTADAGHLAQCIRSSPKPTVILRGGRTTQGHKAAGSHTAAMASTGSAWADLMTQSGAVIVNTIEEMMDTLAAVAAFGFIGGTRVSVFGTGGGVAVSAADAIEDAGLRLVEFPEHVRERLAAQFGAPGTSMGNPVDIPVWGLRSGERSVVGEIVDLVGTGDVADSVLVYLDLGSVFDFNDYDDAVAEIDLFIDGLEDRQITSPVSVVLRSGGSREEDDLVRRLRAKLFAGGMTCFTRIEDAVHTHARLAQRH